MPAEAASPLVRLDPRRLRVFVDVQLEDHIAVAVLVFSDGVTAVELPAIDTRAAIRAARLITAEARLFADRIDTESRHRHGSTDQRD